jgi:hypothetical protein
MLLELSGRGPAGDIPDAVRERCVMLLSQMMLAVVRTENQPTKKEKP